MRTIFGLAFFLVQLIQPAWAEETVHNFVGLAGPYVAERVMADVSQPSAIEFLPDGRALIVQRDVGKLTRVNFATGERVDVSGLKPMLMFSDSGLHDVELHPDYASNGWVYISYSEGQEVHSTVVFDRIRLEDAAVVEQQRIFTADAYSENPYHYGGRIQFNDGYVFFTVGDRQHRERAQDWSNHTGTVVRLHDDGRIPQDNPLLTVEDERNPPRPEIWSYGHRNPQGFMVHPGTGELWENEHGPRGGDELNLIVGGENYGWPEISFGFEYDGGPIGKGIVHHEGMQQPKWVYVPSIAPSDMVIYRGDAFPAWKDSFLIGSLAMAHLNRLVLQDGLVVAEERLANGLLGRIRAVAVDRDGLVYLGSDSGEIWRLKPQ